MRIEKITSIIFSPTGGTKKAVEQLEQVWDLPGQTIDLTVLDDKYESYYFDKANLCILAVPSFGGRVPYPAAARLGRMQGNGAPVILVTSFGNRAYDDTLLELKNIAVKQGFRPIAAVAAVTEHSIMHQYGTGRPDENDTKELKEFARRIQKKLQLTEEEIMDLQVKGNEDYCTYNGVPFKPQAGSQCSNCGVCAESCPTGAIIKSNPKEIDQEKCISCMRCLMLCPNGARELNAVLLKEVGLKMEKACSEPKANELFI